MISDRDRSAGHQERRRDDETTRPHWPKRHRRCDADPGALKAAWLRRCEKEIATPVSIENGHFHRGGSRPTVDITSDAVGGGADLQSNIKGKENKLYAATCRHCGRAIVQHPSGVWIPRERPLKSDADRIYCHEAAGGRRPTMLHEPMPSGLGGAPRWVSSDTSGAGGTADVDTDAGPHDAPPQQGQDAASGEIVRHAVVGYRAIAELFGRLRKRSMGSPSQRRWPRRENR
jgi:hypothetical protein